MSIERKRQISCQEYLSYQRFAGDFKNYYLAIQPANLDNIYNPYDLALTATTQQEYLIELKQREYPIQSLSADTWIQLNKYEKLQAIQNNNPEKIIVYFNYCQDGYISYNLSERFKTPVKFDWQLANHHTYQPDNVINKAIIHLKFNPQIDKLKLITTDN